MRFRVGTLSDAKNDITVQYSASLGEIIVYDRALKNTAVSQVLTYLQEKWFPTKDEAATRLEIHGSYYLDVAHMHPVVQSPLYKKIELAYREQFFVDGSILTRSLVSFRDIENKIIQDNQEGWSVAVGRGSAKTGLLVSSSGSHALIYCLTANPDAAFAGYDSQIIVNAPQDFVSCIIEEAEKELNNRNISIVRVLFHEVHYQYSRCISGPLNPSWNVLRGRVDHRTVELLEEFRYFIKDISYAAEREIRLLLVCDKEPPASILLKCSRAPSYCS